MLLAVRQPTMRRLKTSNTSTVNAIPDQVGTQAISSIRRKQPVSRMFAAGGRSLNRITGRSRH